MNKHKSFLVVILLLTLSVTLLSPAAPAYAYSLTDLLPQTTDTGNPSAGNSLMNILLGLLLGNIIGNVTHSNSGNASSAISPNLGKLFGANSSVSQTGGSGQAIIKTAQKYMGVPYVWGATTPDGWDCSGFTQYVMKENGISIPRTAAEQFAAGTPVDRNNLQAGDLVFFTTYKSGASHVGFYMGGGKFIHASSVGKQVTISSLDEQYYSDHYIGARRYTN